MGFFAEFNTWLNALLATYIGDNTARVADLLTPAIVTLAVLYVMVWGYLQLMGQTDEPFVAGLKRIVMLAVILGASLQLWLYNAVLVDSFFNAPGQLAAGVVGAYDSVTVVDRIIFAGDDAATLLIQKGGIFNGDFSYYVAGFAVYLIVGLTAIYTIFLLALSRIALSVLLALGPLFIALLFFETTKRFFESWIAQLANYAFISILTVLVAALMMTLVSTAAQQAASAGGGIQIAQAVREHLWCRKCGPRLGIWWRDARHSSVHAGIPDGSGDDAVGRRLPQVRLLPAARGERGSSASCAGLA